MKINDFQNFISVIKYIQKPTSLMNSYSAVYKFETLTAEPRCCTTNLFDANNYKN